MTTEPQPRSHPLVAGLLNAARDRWHDDRDYWVERIRFIANARDIPLSEESIETLARDLAEHAARIHLIEEAVRLAGAETDGTSETS